FLCMSLSARPEGEQAGRTLGEKVSGKLAGCWKQTAGQLLVQFTELKLFSFCYTQNSPVLKIHYDSSRISALNKIIDSLQSPTPSDIRIYAERQVYPTNKDIIFLVVTDIPDPVEFLWDFGDSRGARTRLRTITKRYHKPGRYNVVAAASWGQMSVTSDVFRIEIQRVVKLSRLVHQASVLRNQTLTVTCRVNAGTNLTFIWSFGDGTTRPGLSTTRHVFHRLGEFAVKVIASNLISSASLSSYVFVVDRPCRPPHVKNMGPLKRQVERHEVIHLGVTFESDVECDISEGLRYSWTLLGSGGQIINLSHTDTQRQSLILQSHLLQYDTYNAIARVQVIGSVVYSNYTVAFQVKPSPPVAFIQGGTNVFIGKTSSNVVTLDGQKSYDPDFPKNPLSYSWACKPVSTITSSCFDQDIPTSSPVLKFPPSLLKTKFDQFQFTLTVLSGERSASSEAFLTVTSHLTGKVSVFCHQCQGDHVNWDQSFSIRALCEDCSIHSELIQYTWSLYLVNASSKPITEVPFCYTVDVSSPSVILEDPTTSTLTPEMSKESRGQPDQSGALVRNRLLQKYCLPLNLLALFAPLLDLSRSGSSHTSVLDRDTRLPRSREIQSESSADWRYAFPLMEADDVAHQPGSGDYDAPYPSVEEGDSAGRSYGTKTNPIDHSESDLMLLKNEGSNLVDPKPSVAIQEPTLLDFHRDAVEKGLFESYTYTGISSTLLIFRPFSLKPRSIYMLQVTAKSQNNWIGQTQLFLKTNPVPEGVRCQVRPVEGMELHTPFSIFCTSGREDLEYKYSYSIGGRPPRTMYQGRDFLYYFSLPSGDPRDDHEVKIYTEIRSSISGSATKPCPVAVRVRPSFIGNDSSSSPSHRDPALKLSECLRNLSSLVSLGNPVEIRNYVSLLTSVLNKLGQDAEANTHAQRHTRNVLIRTLCDFKGSDEKSVADSIIILNELLQVTNQVTLTSVRRVATFVRSVSEILPEFSANRESLINSVSYCLQVVTSCSCTSKAADCFNRTCVVEPGSPTAQSTKDSENASDSCAQESPAGPHLQHGGAAAANQLMEEILQTAADLMLVRSGVDVLPHEAKQHRVTTGPVELLASSQNRTSVIVRSGFTTVRMPAALIQSAFGLHAGGSRLSEQQSCVSRVLTQLDRNLCPRDAQLETGGAFTLTSFSQLTGPVVDFSLFKCNRRKIQIHSLPQPVDTEIQLPQRNSSTGRYVLLRNQISYHNFSISQQLLQQSIQITVTFTPLPSKPFPVMLLFRMFERPTPNMHHLKRIHQWEQNTMRVTLPPSYLGAAGVAHMALLNAEFARLHRSRLQSEQISYSVTAHSSLCLSWDGQQGVWTHRGCRTHQSDTSSAVNCSCYQLRPLTVYQQQIQISQVTGDLDPFLSASSDPVVLSILAVLLVLYILGLVWSQRADALSKENQRLYFLPDNNPADPYLYAVCIHTGLCSASCMTAKVYMVLHGEDGVSQTKELQVPGCTLFRRNTKDTFILSAADSLGPVRGVHVWHDNSGDSPDWYLKQVAVSRGPAAERSWLFDGELWLSVNEGDGQVERKLRVSSGETRMKPGFMLFLRFFDYLADFHMWLCVYSCPSPSSHTHTQRLSVCLLLLSGYACANTVIISHADDQRLFEVGVVDVSAVSFTTGLQSVMVVLPVAALISFLFRLTGNTRSGSGIQRAKREKTPQDDFQGRALLVALPFSLFLKKTAVVLWIHSLCVSLLVCMFFIQPALVITITIRLLVSFWWSSYPSVQTQHGRMYNQRCFPLWCSVSMFLQLLRARHLRLARPPAPAELKKTCGKRRREAVIREMLRDFSSCTLMLLLMVCIISGSSVKEHQNLNKAVKRHFIRHNFTLSSIKTHEDWWEWTQSSLLDYLYQNSSAKPEQPHVVIGEPKHSQYEIFLSEAASKLKTLKSSSWMGRWMVALKVQFTLYSPAPHLFSSVSLISEQSPDGVLLHSVKVQSVRVLHTTEPWDYVAMVSKLLFLFLILLQSYNQVSIVAQQGLMGCRRRPWINASLFCSVSPAQVSLLPVTLICYSCLTYHSAMIMEVVSLLQTQHRGHVDVSTAASWEQNIRTLWGVVLFLLTIKCVTLLGMNRTLSSSAAVLTQTLSSLFWPVFPKCCRTFALTRTFLSYKVLFTDALSPGRFQTHVLEELESSIDELLFRLDVLSNSMNQTHRYREGDSPVLPASPHFILKQISKCTQIFIAITSRSKVEMETPKISEGTSETLKIKNWMASPESTSSETLWSEDICEKQPELQAGTNHTCWFTGTHYKLVEVLVHKEPEPGEP
uniref:Polycystic kidney disease 1a n=1 Tax=Poecilia mexicana TaxID=48701 RepID=A0A3B3YBB8_9TELE